MDLAYPREVYDLHNGHLLTHEKVITAVEYFSSSCTDLLDIKNILQALQN